MRMWFRAGVIFQKPGSAGSHHHNNFSHIFSEKKDFCLVPFTEKSAFEHQLLQLITIIQCQVALPFLRFFPCTHQISSSYTIRLWCGVAVGKEK